ncbi:MAG: uncharacterized protein A8A55_1076 [Amphiamblys sp. WSBS2006]|nr:MAG: uncharacterized protein A8A55_1076 [Amphiamblys sp. WSBS2006]
MLSREKQQRVRVSLLVLTRIASFAFFVAVIAMDFFYLKKNPRKWIFFLTNLSLLTGATYYAAGMSLPDKRAALPAMVFAFECLYFKVFVFGLYVTVMYWLFMHSAILELYVRTSLQLSVSTMVHLQGLFSVTELLLNRIRITFWHTIPTLCFMTAFMVFITIGGVLNKKDGKTWFPYKAKTTSIDDHLFKELVPLFLFFFLFFGLSWALHIKRNRYISGPMPTKKTLE